MNFEPLNVAAYPRLKPYFDGHPYGLSVYTLPSLIIWNTPLYPASYALQNGWVVIRSESARHPEKRHLLLPVAPDRLPTPAELADLARWQGCDTFQFVPEEVLNGWEPAAAGRLFTWTEEPGFSDYVYRAEDLQTLRGNRYAKKRNQIHQFAKEYLDRERVRTAPLLPEDVPECLAFLEQWCAERDCSEETQEDLACERIAVIQALNNGEALAMPGIVVRIDGAVQAFAMVSRLNAATGVLNVEKAFSRVKGLYQYLDNECAKRLFADREWINKECDMTLPDLAHSKQSYHPARRVKSYRLTLRS